MDNRTGTKDSPPIFQLRAHCVRWRWDATLHTHPFEPCESMKPALQWARKGRSSMDSPRVAGALYPFTFLCTLYVPEWQVTILGMKELRFFFFFLLKCVTLQCVCCPLEVKHDKHHTCIIEWQLLVYLLLLGNLNVPLPSTFAFHLSCRLDLQIRTVDSLHSKRCFSSTARCSIEPGFNMWKLKLNKGKSQMLPLTLRIRGTAWHYMNRQRWQEARRWMMRWDGWWRGCNCGLCEYNEWRSSRNRQALWPVMPRDSPTWASWGD